MAYRIVTDSASNLVEEMIDEFGLEVLPMTFMVDGMEHRSYLKGAKTDLKQFYTMMREGKVITTSLPNMQETEDTLRAILEQGDDVLIRASRALFPEPTRQRPFLWSSSPENTQSAPCEPKRRSRHRAAKACSSTSPARKRKKEQRSTKSAISSFRRETICATGSPSTT